MIRLTDKLKILGKKIFSHTQHGIYTIPQKKEMQEIFIQIQLCYIKKTKLKKCAIIDAKYYGYHSGDCSSLPSMESIAKQIHYGQYIFSKAADFGLSEPEKSIINIFLIPKELTPIYKDIEYIGCAIEPWNLAEFNYKKILCFAIDTRSLIMDYSKNDIRKAILTNNARKIIEEEFPCEH